MNESFNHGVHWTANRRGDADLQEQFGYTYDKALELSNRTACHFVQNFAVNNLNELKCGILSGTLIGRDDAGSGTCSAAHPDPVLVAAPAQFQETSPRGTCRNDHEMSQF